MYTATVHHNFRDAYTASPKVLLTDIRDDRNVLFRDHCWVSLDDLHHVVPKSNRYKATIKFNAKVKSYQTYGPPKETLCNFTHVKRVPHVSANS
jgi:hypothetical protein